MHLDIYTCTGRRWDVCIIWVCICIVYIHMICILHYRYLSALFLEMLQKQKWNLLTRLFTFASSAGVGFGLWGWKSLGTYVRHGGYLVGSPSRKMRVPEIFFFYLIGPIWWLKNPRFFKNYSGVISTYIGSLTSLHALPAKVSLVSGFTQVWCSSLSLPLRCCALRLNVFCHMNPWYIYVRMCVCVSVRGEWSTQCAPIIWRAETLNAPVSRRGLLSIPAQEVNFGIFLIFQSQSPTTVFLYHILLLSIVNFGWKIHWNRLGFGCSVARAVACAVRIQLAPQGQEAATESNLLRDLLMAQHFGGFLLGMAGSTPKLSKNRPF